MMTRMSDVETVVPDEPNTGPDKVPGVFQRNDLVRLAGRWSTGYIVVGPGVREDLLEVVKDCGCPGTYQVPRDQVLHEYHWLHGDSR